MSAKSAARCRLVVNADDLGLHARLDEGILRAHAEGVVTSASVLAAGRNVVDAVARARAQKIGLGAHLSLTTHLDCCAPAGEVRWLAPGGRLRKNWREFSTAWLGGLIPPQEVATEFRAQVEKLQKLGVKIDHLDTHQHLHLLPGVQAIVEALAAELSVPVRWPKERPHWRWLFHPRQAVKATLLGVLARVPTAPKARRVRAHGVFESGGLTETRLLRLLGRLGAGEHEVMCHPGLTPGLVPEDVEWRYEWETEFAAVTSARVRALVAERNIELCTYATI